MITLTITKTRQIIIIKMIMIIIIILTTILTTLLLLVIIENTNIKYYITPLPINVFNKTRIFLVPYVDLRRRLIGEQIHFIKDIPKHVNFDV